MTACHSYQSIGLISGSSLGRSREAGAEEPQFSPVLPIQCRVIDDEEIVAGRAETEWDGFGLDAELEWCLIFQKPLAKLTITKDLECLLQGSIRERRLVLKKKGEGRGHPPASRSIIAMSLGDHAGYFGGVATTLSAIFSDQIGASMHLHYEKENMEGGVDRVVSSAVLAGKDLVSSLLKIQKRALERTGGGENVVRLQSLYCHGGYLQDRWLKYQSALTAVKGVHYSTIADSTIRTRLMSDVIERRENIKRGTSAELTVLDAGGHYAGSSVLSVM